MDDNNSAKSEAKLNLDSQDFNELVELTDREKLIIAAIVSARRFESRRPRAADAARETVRERAPKAPSLGNRLTPREHEVLSLILAGTTNKEAARRLGISPRTVEVHRNHIMKKVGAHNAVQLAQLSATLLNDPVDA